MPATYEEALRYLDGLTNLGIKPGLSRMEALVDFVGRPHTCAPVVHITGTNGKTSTARITSAILQHSGLRTGTYTSPHLQTVNERIAVDLLPLSNDAFAAAFADAVIGAEELQRLRSETPSYFEMVTLMAFVAFADAPVGVQVIEVGMGGRWDATNVADADVAVVTNVSLDHVRYLGSTPPLIAAEKAGIIKEGTILIVGEENPELIEVFESVAGASGASGVFKKGKDFSLQSRSPAVGGQLISVRGIHADYDELFLPLFGRYQAENTVVAIAASEALLGTKLDQKTLEAALASVTSPGRMELVGRHPMVVLDGAHNPAGIAACIEAVNESFFYDNLSVVFGVFEDKDYHEMLSAISRLDASLYATQATLARSASADRIAAAARKLGIRRVRAFYDVPSALDAAIAEAGTEDLVLITGSLYMIGEARTHLLGPPDLDR